MLIPFKNIEGRNVAQAEVEIPDRILNHFPSSMSVDKSYLNIPHVRNGVFTGIMGDAPLRFLEEPDKLTMPDKEYKGIHVTPPTENLLNKLGFQKRSGAAYWHPGFGPDDITHWIFFDIQTDDLPFLIKKIFNLGYSVGYTD
jgi:hypothetical protein